MREYQASPLSRDKYLLAESPFYDERTGLLSYVDIEKGCLYTMDKDMKVSCFEAGQKLGAAVLTMKADCFVLCGTDGLYLYNGDTTEKLLELSDEFGPYRRCNDAKADPRGRLFFGSSVWKDGIEAGGNLYCYDHGEVRIVQENTRISNGMAWSSDHKSFFFSDSLEYAVFKYDYDIETGNISNRRVLFNVQDGVPDGMCIDSQDRLWVAFWGGSRIECRDTTSGELLARVNVPARHVTSCCFYGEASDELFITTSGQSLDGEFDGCLFTCKVDAKGTSNDLFQKDRIKAFIFDMDGTLIDTEKIYRQIWPRAVADLGLVMTDDMYLTMRSLGRPFAPLKFKEWFGDEGIYDEARRIRKGYFDDYIAEHGIDVKKGAFELLKYLHERHVITAIATATDIKRADEYLKRTGLYGQFDRIISATMVDEGKPSPKVYEYACETLGLKPSECVAVEDAPNGVMSACRAGLGVIMVPDQSSPSSELMRMVSKRVDSLNDVIGLWV